MATKNRIAHIRWRIQIIKTVRTISLKQNCLSQAFKERESVLISSNIETPMLFGLFKPHIYLPAEVSEGDRNYVIRHERTHMQYGDHWWKLLGVLVLALHWFNPLVWAAFAAFGRDIEYACNEAVIQSLDKDGRRRYAHCLIDYSTINTRSIAVLTFGKDAARERVENIMKYTKKKKMIVYIGILACVIVVLFMTTHASNATEKITSAVLLDPIEKGMQVRVGLGEQDLWEVNAASYKKELQDLIPILSEIDKKLDLTKYRLSVIHYDDMARQPEVLITYYIGEHIKTDRGFSFAIRDGVLTKMVYSPGFYDDHYTKGIDEQAMIDAVLKDRDQFPNMTMQSDEDEIRDYYLFRYRSKELNRVIETYRFDGVDWISNEEEKLLYKCE